MVSVGVGEGGWIHRRASASGLLQLPPTSCTGCSPVHPPKPGLQLLQASCSAAHPAGSHACGCAPAAGPAALPSCLAHMDAAEFAARMQRGNPCALPPLVYGRRSDGGAAGAAGAGAEHLYFQAELPPGLLADCGLDGAPFAPPGLLADCGGLRRSQAARVWIGAQGTVSPTHYDLSQSFLTQIQGR